MRLCPLSPRLWTFLPFFGTRGILWRLALRLLSHVLSLRGSTLLCRLCSAWTLSCIHCRLCLDGVSVLSHGSVAVQCLRFNEIHSREVSPRTTRIQEWRWNTFSSIVSVTPTCEGRSKQWWYVCALTFQIAVLPLIADDVNGVHARLRRKYERDSRTSHCRLERLRRRESHALSRKLPSRTWKQRCHRLSHAELSSTAWNTRWESRRGSVGSTDEERKRRSCQDWW